MSLNTSMLTILRILMLLIMITPPLLIFYLWRRDRNQREHSVLRNFPILGKLRYIFEKMGPELRQYLFLNDDEAKPYSRNEYESAVIAGKYKSRIIGFGSLGDRAITALALGADLVNIARGLMFNIHAQVCHTNRCPVGVATKDPKLQRALVVNEKSFRVTNYIISLREGLYNMTAASGVRSPTELSLDHVVYQGDRTGT